MSSLPVSAVVPVYKEDEPSHFAESLDSITKKQTRSPSEVVIVADGPLTPELNEFLDDRNDVTTIRLEQNRGAGAARAAGVKNATNNLIAFQDSDDLSVSERFERQIRYFRDHPKIDALGGYIAEFEVNPDQPHAVRKVPTRSSKITRWGKVRSPLNQTTVMAKRDSMLAAGNYRPDDRMEDYSLWARMLANGMKLANLPDVLAKVRAGESEMSARRGGVQYAREEIRLQREFYRIGFVSAPLAFLNVAIRVPVRLMPSNVRSFSYQRFLRN